MLPVELGLLGLGLRLPGGAGGSLGLSACALCLPGGPARLANPPQVAVDRPLEPIPRPGLLLPLPEGDEPFAEQLSPGFEIDG